MSFYLIEENVFVVIIMRHADATYIQYVVLTVAYPGVIVMLS